jgi:hypothetical protein
MPSCTPGTARSHSNRRALAAPTTRPPPTRLEVASHVARLLFLLLLLVLVLVLVLVLILVLVLVLILGSLLLLVPDTYPPPSSRGALHFTAAAAE